MNERYSIENYYHESLNGGKVPTKAVIDNIDMITSVNNSYTKKAAQ
jgi:hypothetical protein